MLHKTAPAFPSTEDGEHYQGLTCREYFAIQLLPTLIEYYSPTENGLNVAVQTALVAADKLIAAL